MAAEPAEPAVPTTQGSSLLRKLLSVRVFAVVTIVHCVFFTGLMICALILNSPDPITSIFGVVHGVLYMIVVAACIVAAKIGTLSVTTALIVAVIGGFAPYVGAVEVVRELRRGRSQEPALDGA